MNTFLQDMVLSEHYDRWQFPVGAKEYKVAKAYQILSGNHSPMPVLQWIWKSCCQLKHKIFYWLLAHNRLNTKALLLRKQFFLQDYSCIMCGQTVIEHRDHLFLHCPFAQICWSYLCPRWTPTHSGFQDEVKHLKQLLAVPFSMETIILASWAIWITRNDYIFKGIVPNLYSCRKKFKEELKWVIYRAKRKEYGQFEDWVSTFR